MVSDGKLKVMYTRREDKYVHMMEKMAAPKKRKGA